MLNGHNRFLRFISEYSGDDMKEFFRTLIVCLFVIFVASSCSAKSPNLDLAVCGSYGVPGMFCSELKGNSFSCEVLETDEEGRTLFSFSTQNVITGKVETAFVICQAFDSDYVYYYEDVCYLFSDLDVSMLNTSNLKSLNNWGLPLNQSKMSRRSNKISADLFIITNPTLDYQRLRAICCEEKDAHESQIKEFCFLDEDCSGRTLYWFSFEKDGSLKRYFVFANSSYQVSFFEAEGTLADYNKIASFKKTCEWAYGF